jgi:GT2 family glycosyltransferase/SAM-dependent methyltransferase
MIAGAEIFQRPRDRNPLAFSGERLTSAMGGQVEIEHLHRYFVARALCRDRDVLDVACGEGYGSALLAQVARSVTGLDYDATTVAHARVAFGQTNLCFAQGDATALPFADASFDAVVSFETIEHFAGHDAFLSEIRRVLRPGGMLVISSPDRDFYSGPGTQPNPFHVRELTRAEFCALLQKNFAHVATTLQRPIIGSVLMPFEEGGPRVPTVFERRGDDLVRGASGLPHALYVVSVASDSPVALPPSLYIDNSDLDGPARNMAALREETKKIGLQATEFSQRCEASEAARAELATSAERQAQALSRLEAALAASEAREAAQHCALNDARESALQAEQAHRLALDQAMERHAAAESAMAAGHAADLAAATAAHEATFEAAAQAAADHAQTQARLEAAQMAALAELDAEQRRLRQDLAHTEQSLAHAVQAAASAELRLAAVEGSSVWKSTWPLRRLAGRTPRAAKLARRLAQLGWWTISLQLPQRLRWWRANRAARLAPPVTPPASLMPDMSPVDIVLPAHAAPVVCVIVPSYGQVDYSLRCLASIAAHPPAVPFEVIVAEDASGDPAVAQLRQVKGLRLLESSRNRGFLLNCNAAAGQTQAEFLFFLNNDTQVQPGWLDRLVEVLRRRPDAAAVGAKLIFPDGRLQEAGGIIWDDASGWNYGRLDDADKPVYNYLREADYVSGAALLVRRADFAALGGFDPAYAPAYCEDSDLAFRLRAAGKAVLYQPRAVVVHFEGVTHGPDLGAGMKAHQVTNQARLRARWQRVLSATHYPNATHVMRARDRARGRKLILVIDHYVPQPDRDAGSRTMLAFLRAFQQAGSVVKFWTENGAYSEGYTEALQDQGIEVLYGPSTGGFDAWIAENGAEIDGVLLSRPHISKKFIAPLRRHSQARLAYYGHDLHGARMRRQALATGDGALAEAAEAIERQERDVWRLVDVVLYPSAEEADAATALEAGILARAVVPYAFAEFSALRPPPEGQAVLFVAGFGHPPNEDAAVWFVEAILPLIRARHPTAMLWIVGSHPTARVRGLSGDGVSIAANVSDAELAGFYRRARVAAVPLRYGAGVKLKVVEALAQGLPLVTTPVGAQGCEGLGEVITIAEDPAIFADAICRLLADDAAWTRIAAREIDYVKQHFSEAGLRESLMTATGF